MAFTPRLHRTSLTLLNPFCTLPIKTSERTVAKNSCSSLTTSARLSVTCVSLARFKIRSSVSVWTDHCRRPVIVLSEPRSRSGPGISSLARARVRTRQRPESRAHPRGLRLAHIESPLTRGNVMNSRTKGFHSDEYGWCGNRRFEVRGATGEANHEYAAKMRRELH